MAASKLTAMSTPSLPPLLLRGRTVALLISGMEVSASYRANASSMPAGTVAAPPLPPPLLLASASRGGLDALAAAVPAAAPVAAGATILAQRRDE
jgi:hypothetical protein